MGLEDDPEVEAAPGAGSGDVSVVAETAHESALACSPRVERSTRTTPMAWRRSPPGGERFRSKRCRR